MSSRVLVTDYMWPSLDIERGILAEAGAELVVAEQGEPDELIRLAEGVSAILTNWKRVPAEALEAAPGCVVVSRYGVGVDNIPVERATELGIMVVNVPDFCLDEVSDHAMALLLACARRIVPFASATRAGTWDLLGIGRGLPRLRGQTARHRRVRQHRARTGAEGAGLRPRRARLHAAAGARQRRLGRALDERPRRAAGLLGLRLGACTRDARDARADRRGRVARDEADGLPGQHLARRAGRRGGAAPGRSSRAGSPAPASTCSRRSRRPRGIRCSASRT